MLKPSSVGRLMYLVAGPKDNFFEIPGEQNRVHWGSDRHLEKITSLLLCPMSARNPQPALHIWCPLGDGQEPQQAELEEQRAMARSQQGAIGAQRFSRTARAIWQMWLGLFPTEVSSVGSFWDESPPKHVWWKLSHTMQLWQQRASSPLIKEADTSLSSLAFGDHSPPGSSQTSPGSSCKTRVMCLWLESGRSTDGSWAFLSSERLSRHLPGLAASPRGGHSAMKQQFPCLQLLSLCSEDCLQSLYRP